ncbi:glutathione peroxidase [soil metagenome]
MLDLKKYKLETLKGLPVELDTYKGKILLVVNVASHCGYTPQYEGLQKLYDTYSERGFAVLGFPCNQFGNQEADDVDTIQTFCQTQYGVQFPMFSKVNVNGSEAHPLFKDLKQAAPGILGTEAIKWNFTKFLVDRAGNVVERFGPGTVPNAIAQEIEKLL